MRPGSGTPAFRCRPRTPPWPSTLGQSCSPLRGADLTRLCGAGLLEVGVDASGLGELVFEDDNAARGLECGALVDQFAGAGGKSELVAGVATVTARGAAGVSSFAASRLRKNACVTTRISAA